jgi:hypothetical protein
VCSTSVGDKSLLSSDMGCSLSWSSIAGSCYCNLGNCTNNEKIEHLVSLTAYVPRICWDMLPVKLKQVHGNIVTNFSLPHVYQALKAAVDCKTTDKCGVFFLICMLLLLYFNWDIYVYVCWDVVTVVNSFL